MISALRAAARSVSRRPGLAAAVILTLALGIGVTTALFSVLYAVLLRPLPYQDPERLVLIWQNDALRETERELASAPDFFDWRAQARLFSHLSGYRSWTGSLTSPGSPPEYITGARVSRDFFPLLGVNLFLGRNFLPEEDAPGGERVVILDHGLWRQRFGGDRSILGKPIAVDGVSYVVVGVLPASFVSPSEDPEGCWFPLQASPGENRGIHDLFVFGRLARGATLEQAQGQMSSIMRRLEEEHPEENKGRGALVEPLRDALIGTLVRTSLEVLLAAVAGVLLIACANVGSLLLVRALERQRELALRTVLGARLGKVLGQVSAEALVLALAGGALGLLVASWSLHALLALLPIDVNRLDTAAINGPVLAFALAVTLLTALVCGLLPAFQVFQLDLQAFFKEGGSNSTASGRRQFLRRSIVAAEVALAVVLTISAGLLIKTFYLLQRVDLGFDPKNVLTLDIRLPQDRYPMPPWETVYPRWPEMGTLYARLLEEARAVPGVEQASLAINHPLRAGWTSRLTLDDRPAPPPGEQEEERIRPISPDYFRVTGTAFLRGRNITDQDNAESPKVVLVNRAFVRKYYPEGPEPLGKRVTFWDRSWEIVGIVGDVRFLGPGSDVAPAVYPPFLQAPFQTFSLIVRARGEAGALAPALQKAVWAVDPSLAPFGIATLEQQLSDSVARPRFIMVLLSVFAALALVLAMIGVYGLMAHSVAQRTSEIGIRMALGGSRLEILRLVFGEGVRLTLAGVLLGLVLAFVVTRTAANLLFGVSSTDPVIFLVVAFALALAGSLACLLPSLRATRVEPVLALKYK